MLRRFHRAILSGFIWIRSRLCGKDPTRTPLPGFFRHMTFKRLPVLWDLFSGQRTFPTIPAHFPNKVKTIRKRHQCTTRFLSCRISEFNTRTGGKNECSFVRSSLCAVPAFLEQLHSMACNIRLRRCSFVCRFLSSLVTVFSVH